MRNIMDVINLIDRRISKESEAAELKSELEKFQLSISYRAPEMHIELGSWQDLHNLMMRYMDEYHSKLWYCEVISIFSTNPLDTVIKAMSDLYPAK